MTETKLADSEYDEAAENAANSREWGEPSGKTARRFLPTVARLLRRLGVARGRLIFAIALAMISVTLNVIAPQLLARALDTVFNGMIGRELPEGVSRADAIAQLRNDGNHGLADVVQGSGIQPGQGIDTVLLTRLLIVMVLLYVVSSVIQIVSGLMINRIVLRVIHELREEVEEKLHRLPVSFFDTHQRGDILSRVTNDIDNIQSALEEAFAPLIRNIALLLGVTAVMFALSWQLALIALLTVPLSLLVGWLIGRRSQPMYATQWRHTGRLNAHIEESFTGHQVVKVFHAEARLTEEFGRRNEAVCEATFRAQFWSAMINPLVTFVFWLTYVMVAFVGALRVAAGQLTVGQVGAFIQYVREMSNALSYTAETVNMVQSGVASAERTFELLDAEDEPADTVGATLPEHTPGHVRFEGVSFGYREGEPVIRDVTLEAKPGHTVAIVGPSGAGKTTLVNLVMRFYDPDAGRITIDGVDTRELSRQEVRRHTGMVLQDTFLFPGTIRDNIRYGRLTASDDEVIAAARATMVDPFVRQLPDGYDTVLEENAASLSVGERQLITIARAFLAQPSLLILDEATSSVDTRTETHVQQAMSELRRDRTSLVIAHRLSTVRDADTIVMMEQGRVVEQGSHAELLARGGAYAKLYAAQLAGGEDEDAAETTGAGSCSPPGR